VTTVALIDYGSGNLRSAEKALVEAARLSGGEHTVIVTADPDTVAAAERIVLPGVGAFRACMEELHARPGLVEAMTEAVHDRGAPFLGVCVGMQLLASRGLEFGYAKGLDWIAGEVRPLSPDDPEAKVPHMGWNTVRPETPHALVKDTGEDMYFTHSYAFAPDDPATVTASVEHGGRFAAAVAQGNIAGVQFHPEKSQGAGLALIARFLEWRP
jgi:glutamine amidotransferase